MKKKVEKNLGEFEAVCEDYSYDGKGVTHYQGKVVFVNGFFLNEKAIIRLTYERSEFYIGKIVKLLTKSPSRIEPKCKVCTTCGGCSFQQLDYAAQLDFKTHKVEEAFRKIGNMKIKVLPCLGMENPYYYRNKIQMPVGLSQTGRIITGFYKEKTHEIVPIETCYIENEKAEEVLKHSSTLEGKLGDLVASKKVTIIEDPLMRNVFFRYFDDEGVATFPKTIVEKGVLKTYLHNLSTAHQMGVAPTGNGYKAGAKGKVGISLCNVYLKPGKHTEEEMLSTILEGVYINDVQGLHAGMNMQSGNFSLQAAGFMIRDGKIAEPINLITIAGNLFEILKNVKDIANNSETQLSSITCPSVYVRSIAISGK